MPPPPCLPPPPPSAGDPGSMATPLRCPSCALLNFQVQYNSWLVHYSHWYTEYSKWYAREMAELEAEEQEEVAQRARSKAASYCPLVLPSVIFDAQEKKRSTLAKRPCALRKGSLTSKLAIRCSVFPQVVPKNKMKAE
eukprot:1138649-Pelagomonas_calceolata.AAC.3